MNVWIEQTFAYWGSGGLLLLPMAVVCLGIWGFYLRSRDILAKTIKDGAVVLLHLGEGALGSTKETLCQKLEPLQGGVAAMVRAAINDVFKGAVPREAFAAREVECLNLLKRDMVILVALTTIAPLLGLLGTVTGMIQTFDAVATVGGNTGVRVADGISQALITTQFGLVIAVPGVFGIARLQRMLRNAQVVMAECRSYSLQILEHGVGELCVGV